MYLYIHIYLSRCHKIIRRIQCKVDDGIKSRSTENISRQVRPGARCWRRLLLLKAAHDKFSRVSLLFREERGYTRVGARRSLGERPQERRLK